MTDSSNNQALERDRARIRAAMQYRKGDFYMGSMATAHLMSIFGVTYGKPGLDAKIDSANRETLDKALAYCAPFLQAMEC
jgi:hypothetical protein